MDPKLDIESLLVHLRKAIEGEVLREKLTDQLTGLPNEGALDKDVTELLNKESNFWIAFFEVDHFKKKNSEFGYKAANALLQAIGRQLTHARDYFPDGFQAYRAHGDEFFAIGPRSTPNTTEDLIARCLDRMRGAISDVLIPVPGKPRPMACTVSVGWATSEDAFQGDLTLRKILESLEIVVAEAKRQGRNRVLRFDAAMKTPPLLSMRENCSVCQTALTADIPFDKNRIEYPLLCPNCGNEIPRPPPPVIEPPQEEEA